MLAMHAMHTMHAMHYNCHALGMFDFIEWNNFDGEPVNNLYKINRCQILYTYQINQSNLSCT